MQNSARFLSAIKGIIETNKIFRALYGDLNGGAKGKVWSQYEATVATRVRHDLKEPTLSTAGVDVVKVGMHYDLIILDDPVSENNTTTKEQRDKVINHYKYLLSLLEPTGRMIIIGTRWDYGDLYGYIIEDEADTFDIMIRQAEWDDEDGQKQYLFPARLTPEFLVEIKKSQGSYIYSCQYQNDPVDRDTAVFRKSWIRYYDGEVRNNSLFIAGYPQKFLNIFLLIDPAISTERTADFSALVAVGVDADNSHYVLDYVNERLNPYELDDAIFQMVGKWNPVITGLEHHANQAYFAFTLPEAMKKRGQWFRIQELKPYGDKESRIRRLQPMFENGAVYLKKDMHVLEDQLLRFPFSRHDDVLDALAYVPDLCYPPRTKKDEKIVYQPISLITGY
jgi:predicted phage terminase large subunit-like protein